MEQLVEEKRGEPARTVEVEIERLLPGGVGLAHAEELTLFVSLAAPGDLVRVNIDRVKGKAGFASIVEIVKPSGVRIEPPCPYFGLCGGCDFQQLTYEAQLAAKIEIIRDCLHRIGKIEISEIPMTPSPNQWHYRARAMWQVDSAGKRLGYFVRGSNEVCDVEYCAVLAPELQQTLERTRETLNSESELLVRDIEVVVGDESISSVSHPPDGARFPGKEVSLVIAGETYHFSAEAFFQINHELLGPLITEALRDLAGDSEQTGTALDLYCGVGLFTVPLARRFARVVGVEANARAAKFARNNLKLALLEPPALAGGTQVVSEPPASAGGSLGNVEIITARVGDWLSQHARSFGSVNFLLLDPPRTGCENKDIAGILALRPTRISYVSCDPATLARDLKKLIAAGYVLDSVAAFDMFPQTHHVETVARLTATRHV